MSESIKTTIQAVVEADTSNADKKLDDFTGKKRTIQFDGNLNTADIQDQIDKLTASKNRKIEFEALFDFKKSGIKKFTDEISNRFEKIKSDINNGLNIDDIINQYIELQNILNAAYSQPGADAVIDNKNFNKIIENGEAAVKKYFKGSKDFWNKLQANFFQPDSKSFDSDMERYFSSRTSDDFLDNLKESIKQDEEEIQRLTNLLNKGVDGGSFDGVSGSLKEILGFVDELLQKFGTLSSLDMGSESANTLISRLTQVKELATEIQRIFLKNDISDMLNGWAASDKDIRNTKSMGPEEIRERTATITKNGKIFGGYAFGNNHSSGVFNTTIDSVLAAGETPFIGLHSHPNKNISMMSFANGMGKNTDLKSWGDLYKTQKDVYDEIQHQAVATLGEVLVFDAKRFFDDFQKIDFSSDKINDAINLSADRIRDQYKNARADRSLFLDDFINEYGNADFDTILASALKTHVEKAGLKNADLSGLIKQIKDEYVERNAGRSTKDPLGYVARYLLNQGLNPKQLSSDTLLEQAGLGHITQTDYTSYTNRRLFPRILEAALGTVATKERPGTYDLGFKEEDFINGKYFHKMSFDEFEGKYFGSKSIFSGLFENTGLEEFEARLQAIGQNLQQIFNLDISNSNISSLLDVEVTKLSELEKAAKEAATAKEAVTNANKGLGGSADSTSSKLTGETSRLEEVAESAKEAAENKEKASKYEPPLSRKDTDIDKEIRKSEAQFEKKRDQLVAKASKLVASDDEFGQAFYRANYSNLANLMEFPDMSYPKETLESMGESIESFPKELKAARAGFEQLVSIYDEYRGSVKDNGLYVAFEGTTKYAKKLVDQARENPTAEGIEHATEKMREYLSLAKERVALEAKSKQSLSRYEELQQGDLWQYVPAGNKGALTKAQKRLEDYRNEAFFTTHPENSSAAIQEFEGSLDRAIEKAKQAKAFAKEAAEYSEKIQQEYQGFTDFANVVKSDQYLSSQFGDDIDKLDEQFKVLVGLEISPDSKAEVLNQYSAIKEQIEAKKIEVNAAVAERSNETKGILGEIADLQKGRSGYVKVVNTVGSSGMVYDKTEKQSVYRFAQTGAMDAYISTINEYEDRVAAVTARVEELKNLWGETDSRTQTAVAALDKLKQDINADLGNKVLSEAQKQLDIIAKAKATRAGQNTDFMPDYKDKLDGIEKQIDDIITKVKGVDFSKPFDPTDLQSFLLVLSKTSYSLKDINDQANIKATESSLTKLLQKINSDINKGGMGDALKNDYAELKKSVEGYVNALQKGDKAQQAFVANKPEVKKLADEYNDLKSRLDSLSKSSIGEAINSQTTQFLAQYFSARDLVRYGKEISNTVMQTDAALIELKKVSDASNDRIQQSFTQSSKTAQELGSTITSVINSTADWARLGYDIDEAEELARVTTLYQTVGDNMTQESASKSLVSMLQGFQMDASQAERIVDSVNEVANNFAIDTAGIGDALQRSAAAFNASGTDLNKSIALVTTANSVVQDPSSVGTMFKTDTVFMYRNVHIA